MDMNIEMYIVGCITTFITCWVLYIHSIKRSFATIKERKEEFIDDIWGVCFVVLQQLVYFHGLLWQLL